MKNKVILKMIISLLVFVLVVLSMQVVNADVTVDDITSISKGPQSGIVNASIRNFGGRLLGMVQIIASAIATIMLIGNAIKYMRSAPSEKADIKKQAVVYVVGAIILYATVPILQIIKTFIEGL